MKYSAILWAVMMTVSFNLNASKEQSIVLDSLLWKYRVVLVFTREPLTSNALINLEEFSAEIEEREIAWFVLDDSTLHTNYRGELGHGLREQLVDSYFMPLPTETVVLLIGKDGTLKSRSSDLDLDATFGQIDQMPMRRQEMRRKSGELD